MSLVPNLQYNKTNFKSASIGFRKTTNMLLTFFGVFMYVVIINTRVQLMVLVFKCYESPADATFM